MNRITTSLAAVGVGIIVIALSQTAHFIKYVACFGAILLLAIIGYVVGLVFEPLSPHEEQQNWKDKP